MNYRFVKFDFFIYFKCPSIHIIHCDLSDFSNLESCIKSCGPIDLLVNNAGVALNDSFLDLSLANFDK